MKRCVLVLAMLAAPARAEDVVAYQVEGDAPASGTDARTMALDEAFANAVQNALSELIATDVRVARKGELDKEIVRRARLWVAKFSVTKDETVEGRRELADNVKIDRDKLRDRLGELGIQTKEAVATAPEGAGDDAPGTGGARTVTVLLRVTKPDGLLADYGAGAATDVPGLAALTKLLRTSGYVVRRAPASGPAASGELGDDDIDALAREAKAEVVAIAGVEVGPSVPMRGRPGTASLVTARLRVLDRKDGKLVGQGSASTGAAGDIGYAIDRALLGAAHDVMPPAPSKLGPAGTLAGEDMPIAEPGVVLVRLPARTSLDLVLLEQKFLAGAKGIRSATLRRMSPSGWVIGVTTSQSIEDVARIAKKAPSGNTSTAVKVVDGVVELTLRGGA